MRRYVIFILLLLLPGMARAQHTRAYGHGGSIIGTSDTTNIDKTNRYVYYYTTDSKWYVSGGGVLKEITLMSTASGTITATVAQFDTIEGLTTDSIFVNDDMVLLQDILFKSSTGNVATYWLNSDGDTCVTIDTVNIVLGKATVEDQDDVTLSVKGDADLDVGATTTETLSLSLTGNATPDLATWDWTSTQADEMRFFGSNTYIRPAGVYSTNVLVTNVQADNIKNNSSTNLTIYNSSSQTNKNILIDITAQTGGDGVDGEIRIGDTGTAGEYVRVDSAGVFYGAGNNFTITASGGTKQAHVVVTDAAEYDVLVANSGKVHLIADLSQNTTIDLPAEAAGLNYEFWYIGAATEVQDHTIDSENGDNYFTGGVVHHDTDDGSLAAVYSNGSTNSILTLTNIAGGTIIKVSCDGTDWSITGTVISDTAPAFSDQP